MEVDNKWNSLRQWICAEKEKVLLAESNDYRSQLGQCWMLENSRSRIHTTEFTLADSQVTQQARQSNVQCKPSLGLIPCDRPCPSHHSFSYNVLMMLWKQPATLGRHLGLHFTPIQLMYWVASETNERKSGEFFLKFAAHAMWWIMTFLSQV